MLSLICFLFLHPLHLSTTEIEYHEKAHTLQIISRIFIDDLESSVQNERRQSDLDIMHPPRGLTTKDIISAYLKRHFRIKMDGVPSKVNFIGYKEEGFVLICYLEVEEVKVFTTIEILNTIITDIYEDQSNIVHVAYRGITKSVRLMRNNPYKVITF